MSKGRCAGCGENGPVKAVTAHILSCPDWAALYRQDPSAVLDPGPEHDRWLAEDRKEEKEAAIAGRVAATDDARRAMADRFTARDPLEDW